MTMSTDRFLSYNMKGNTTALALFRRILSLEERI